jgi:hypothetical protein
MLLKTRFLLLFVSFGLVLSGSAMAGPQNQKPPKKVANANANVPKKEGRWAQEKGACQNLNSQAKELETQEKQLFAQAKEKETEEKALIAQASQIEHQREAEEHSLHKGQNNTAAESQIKAQEQQRVSLEHQATEKSKEREALIKQADELGRQRREVEAQHKSQCQFGKGPKAQ